MLPTTNQLPTLGYLHKVVCDCLGLRHSDNEDITFPVAATEKDRRKALQQAFEAIKQKDGMYGSHADLLAVAPQFAPKDMETVKKAERSKPMSVTFRNSTLNPSRSLVSSSNTSRCSSLSVTPSGVCPSWR